MQIIERCHRGLGRITSQLEADDLALASIEALMLRLPEIEPDRMVKLANAEFNKGGDDWQDQPRLPAGQAGGGQWTTDGSSASPGRPDPPRGPGPDGLVEITVPSKVRQSRRRNANGFYPNGAGGGVFYIPTTSGGHAVRPTEVHALNADTFQVGWDAADNNSTVGGSIKLKDAAGRVYRTGTAPAELEHFNATVGRTLGVNIYAFPDIPLGSPDSPSTPEERRSLAEEQAAQDAGTQASIDSPSGQLTTAAGEMLVQLPFLALTGSPAEPPAVGPLNSADELWPESEEVAVAGKRPIVQARTFETGVRAQYPEGKMADRTFSTVTNGERISGVADGAADIHGKTTAIEAKYVANWSRSIRNPASRIGKTVWGTREQARMVAQAQKYSDNFEGGVVYHTNSRELASYYYRLFRAAGLDRFRFVIIAVKK